MTSKIYTLLLTLFVSSQSLHAQPTTIAAERNNFIVHITAFLEKKDVSYFTNIKNVHTKEDNKGIYHYYVGSYKTLEEADSVRRSVVEKGFPYAYVVDVEKVRRECKLTCDTDPSLDPNMPSMMRQIRSLHHLLFDYNSALLRPESKTQLNRLSNVLSTNMSYRVEFKGHTDGRGTPEYNQELSEKRSESARNHLFSRGISANRVKTSSYGMEMPVAKNVKDGKDCPEGRKFNRRVEIFITDVEGNVLNALVEPLDIPTELLLVSGAGAVGQR
jgi:outer membrane protein OmpA-like peptidoglycan-associated protein